MRRNVAVENLNQLRQQTKISRVDLLEALKSEGVSMHQTSLRRIEEGKQPMKLNEAVAIAEVFGISLDQFCFVPMDVDRANLSQALIAFERRLEDIRFEISAHWQDENELRILASELSDMRPELDLLPGVYARLKRAAEIKPLLSKVEKMLGSDMHESVIPEEDRVQASTGDGEG